MGVWIETQPPIYHNQLVEVTPHVGVWIETPMSIVWSAPPIVTPHVGVWIETSDTPRGTLKPKSLPMWECGLKHVERVNGVG